MPVRAGGWFPWLGCRSRSLPSTPMQHQRAGKGLLGATDHPGQYPGGKGRCHPAETGDATDSPPRGCSFLHNLALITQTNSRPGHTLYGCGDDHAVAPALRTCLDVYLNTTRTLGKLVLWHILQAREPENQLQTPLTPVLSPRQAPSPLTARRPAPLQTDRQQHAPVSGR